MAWTGTSGGTHCIGATEPITNSGQTTTTAIVIIAMGGAPQAERECSDGVEYPYKAIVYYNNIAASVGCLTTEAKDQLTKWCQSTSTQLYPLANVPLALSGPLSCPPPEIAPAPGTSSGAPPPTVADDPTKLSALTLWFQNDFLPGQP